MMNVFTEAEQFILKNTSNKYKWIARDETGELWVFEIKPRREDDYYWNVDSPDIACAQLDPFEHMFKKITWIGGPVQFRK